MNITTFSKCNCGAVTLYFENGENNSISEQNLSKFDIKIPETAEELNETFICNHCVNHYGLDLCACGSGDSPKECKEDLDGCGNPYQKYGESVKLNYKFGK